MFHQRLARCVGNGNHAHGTAALGAANRIAPLPNPLPSEARELATARPECPAEKEPYQTLHFVQTDPTNRRHPAVVTNLLKPARQRLLQEATQKLLATDRGRLAR